MSLVSLWIQHLTKHFNARRLSDSLKQGLNLIVIHTLISNRWYNDNTCRILRTVNQVAWLIHQNGVQGLHESCDVDCTVNNSYKVKVTLSVSTSQRRTEGVVVKLHWFLTLALSRGEWSTPRLSGSSPENPTHLSNELKICREVLEERKIFCTSRNLKPGTSRSRPSFHTDYNIPTQYMWQNTIDLFFPR